MSDLPRKGAHRASKSMIVNRITVGARRYVLRWQRCPSKGCWCRSGEPHRTTGALGHGPYWFGEFTWAGKTRYVYIGKVLDTDKKVLPDGQWDYQTIIKGKKTGVAA